MEKRYIEVLCQANFNECSSQENLDQSEIMQIIHHIQNELDTVNKLIPLDELHRQQLQVQLKMLLVRLP